MTTKTDTGKIHPRPSLVNRPNSERNDKLYDAWSLMHLASGIVFGWILVPVVAIAALVLYEPFENFVLSPLFARINIDFGFESLRNALSDIFFDMVGWVIGYFVLSNFVELPFRLL